MDDDGRDAVRNASSEEGGGGGPLPGQAERGSSGHRGPGAGGIGGIGGIGVGRTRVLYISLVAIFSAFVVEFTLGMISNSLALITDSAHALLDCVVTAILLIAAKMAIKPPDAEHTYGHGKIESLGGMLGGIAIFGIACYFIYEAVSRLQAPSPPDTIPGIIAIAGGVYTIGIDVFRIVLLRRSISKMAKEAGPAGAWGGDSTVRADLYHAVMDLGSTGVAIAGIAIAQAGAYQGDFAAAIILGGLLVALSIKLVYRTALDLTDVISPDMVERVRGIAGSTEGVRRTGAVLMRRSGGTVFADITISLRGDVSFERAHEISASVERNVALEIRGAHTTVHFEPDWRGVPLDARIADIARTVDGVREVHNANTHMTEGMTYADLHVMVDRTMSLASAHRISEIVEYEIGRQMPDIRHTTVHLEPFAIMPKAFESEDAELSGKIRGILSRYPQVRRIGRIVSLSHKSAAKIDIDCSFEGGLSIEEVHELTSEIERAIARDLQNAVITIHPEPA